MEKSKLLPVIAAIMITSMAVSMLSFSTTSVVRAQGAIELTPLRVRDNALVLFTLTVTNTGTENIENIVVKQTSGGSTGSGFSAPMGGENSKENWYAVADNLIKAATFLGYVKDNLAAAGTNITAAAAALLSAANLLDTAGYNALSAFPENIKNAGENIRQAATALIKAQAKLLSTDNADWGVGVADNIANAGGLLVGAGAFMDSVAGYTAASWVHISSENIENIGRMLENVALGFGLGRLKYASENAENVYLRCNDAGLNMAAAGSDNLSVISVGYVLENAAIYFNYFADNLRYAKDNIIRAGVALENAWGENIGSENSGLGFSCRTLKTAGDRSLATDNQRNLLSPLFLSNIRDAGRTLRLADGTENVYLGGVYLDNAATSQAVWLGPAFASDIIGVAWETTQSSVRYWLAKAGENLDNEGHATGGKGAARVNLAGAASCFGSAATALNTAAAKIKATADLVPSGSGYRIDNLAAIANANAIVLYPNCPVAAGENRITAGSTKTFNFLWNMPDISIENAYTVTVYPKRADNSDIETLITSFTITVDGLTPQITSLVVSQAGVTANNVVGKVLDNGKATITLTASKPLSDLGDTYIDNRGGLSILGPITWDNWTKSDNLMEFKYDFYVTGWTENVDYENVRVRVSAPCATDANALENNDNALDNFVFDFIKPVLIDNDLAQFVALPSATQPGRTENYRYSRQLQWSINGRAEDNEGYGQGGSADNAKATWVTVTVNGAVASRDSVDNFIKTLVLSNGKNSIVIRATDRVGNYAENRIDNIFIDNVKPTAACTQITKIIGGVRTLVTFSNDMKINDNAPWFKFAVTDNGYPTTGWGIFHKTDGIGTTRDNLVIKLDNDNNFLNDQAGVYVAFDNLDNMAAYDSGLTGVYENHWPADNLLATGTYFIHIRVNDNLHADNENVSYRFYIDVTKPATTDITIEGAAAYVGTSQVAPYVRKSTTLSLSGTIPAAEVGSVVTIYVGGVAVQTVTTTTTSWSTSVTLTAGSAQRIEVTLTDTAGNESDKNLYGYFMADGTAPTVTISSPATGTSTDKTSIQITGTVTKDTWEDYTDLTINIQVGGATPGVVTPGTDGSFTSSAMLGEGTNVVTITARDAAGNIGSDAITIERAVTPLTTYAIILVVVALILAAIAIFRKEMK